MFHVECGVGDIHPKNMVLRFYDSVSNEVKLSENENKTHEISEYTMHSSLLFSKWIFFGDLYNIHN